MVKIKIRNLSFAYRKSEVLKNLSLDIETGKLTAFIGPNGSGKSTLIKCIDNILPVNRDCIFIEDKDVKSLSKNQKAKLMAYVPQQEREVFSLTVYETILMGRKPYIGWAPLTNDFKIVNQVIEDLDLENISSAFLNELSGGQRQRVLIGRALAQQPEILLLDEPTASLDLKHQLEVMLLLQKLAQTGMTVIIAVHDLNLALKYCDHFIMLNNGEVFANGDKEIFTPENIRKLYAVDVEILKLRNSTFIAPQKPVETLKT